MGKKKEIKIGTIFTYFTVIEFSFIKNGFAYWKCRCKCGKEKDISGVLLRNKRIKSCGCLRLEKISTHNMSKTKIYQVWRSMIRRCGDPNHQAYKNYGRRGIKVCKRWQGKNGFMNFLEDMGIPEKGLTLERTNNNLGYFKENCMWATMKNQRRNSRQNKFVEYDNKKMCLSEWAEIRNINRTTINFRLLRGWSIGEALGFIKRKKKILNNYKER